MNAESHSFARRVIRPAAVSAAACLLAAALGRFTGAEQPLWVFGKLALALTLMILLLRERVSIGFALLAGAVFLGLAFHLSAARIAEAFTFGAATGAPRLRALGAAAFRLALMVTLINFLGQTLIVSGGVKRLILSLERLLRDGRWVLAAIPSVIGLLPMPGGAMLSAPIVNELGDGLALSPVQKTLANYWFRHIWEWWWPLFPAILIVVENKYLTLGQVAAYMGPFTLAAIALGWFFILRPIPRPATPASDSSAWIEALHVLRVLWPVLLVVAAIFLVRLPAPYGDWVLPSALAAVNALLVASLRMDLGTLRDTLRKAVQWKMVFLVFGVYVLRAIFEMSHAAEQLPEALAVLHVPALAACFLAPFLINAITGYNLAGVSMALPLLAAVFAKQTGPAGVAVAYAGAFVGVLCSPVHLCLALTREYYQAEWGAVYRGLLPLLAGLVALAAFIGWVG